MCCTLVSWEDGSFDPKVLKIKNLNYSFNSRRDLNPTFILYNLPKICSHNYHKQNKQCMGKIFKKNTTNG